MTKGGVKPALFAASASALCDPARYRAAYAAASPVRRKKVDGYRFEQDRRLSLCAELLLRYGLNLAGVGDIPIEYCYGKEGKPYLKDSGVQFSLSHSGEYALCAIAPCEVGCDIEKIRPVNLNIAKRFFSGEEYEDILYQETEEGKSERFFRYWTLKESYIKTIGLGLRLPLNSFRMELSERISMASPVHEREYSFFEYDEIPGYRCALCAEGEWGDVPLVEIDPVDILYREKKKKS